MFTATRLTSVLLAAAVAALSAAGGDGAVVCFGADGHVGIVGAEDGACHDHAEPHARNVVISTQSDSCTDIAIPAGLAPHPGRPLAKPAPSTCRPLPVTNEPVTNVALGGIAATDAPPDATLPLAGVRVVVLLI